MAKKLGTCVVAFELDTRSSSLLFVQTNLSQIGVLSAWRNPRSYGNKIE